LLLLLLLLIFEVAVLLALCFFLNGLYFGEHGGDI
jgi:hypothetical protein